MEYTFKYNSVKGNYEVHNGTKIEKECNTMQEARAFIDSKNGKVESSDVPKTNTTTVGFGNWGVPTYMMKAESGNYGTEK